jgi:hypothetical protein
MSLTRPESTARPRPDRHGDHDRIERVPVRVRESGADRLFRLLVQFHGHGGLLFQSFTNQYWTYSEGWSSAQEKARYLWFHQHGLELW